MRQLMSRKLWVMVLSLTLVLGWAAVGSAAEVSERDSRYVASTAWTAAIAEAAGATDVEILAPLELRHPPEYDFRPSDVAKVLEADMIFWGGYEGFIRKLVAANDISDNRLYRITTNNSPDILVAQTRAIAEKLGTQEAQQAWEKELDELLAALKQAAQNADVAGTQVIVNFHQEMFVRWLGYDVVGVIGQDELTPNKIGELVASRPTMVIDNWHNAQGAPVAEAASAQHIELLNFPGTHGTSSILSLLEYNARQLGLLN